MPVWRRACRCRSLSAARSGWATAPSLRLFCSSAWLPHRGLGVRGRPVRSASRAVKLADQARAFRRQQGASPCRRFRRGRSAKRKPEPSISSSSVLARSLRPGMAAQQLRAGGVVERAFSRRRLRRGAAVFSNCAAAPASRRVADVVAVEVLELGEIEPRGERPMPDRSNHSIISSVEKISSSPWLQPSRRDSCAAPPAVAHGAIGSTPSAPWRLDSLAPSGRGSAGYAPCRHVPAQRLVDLRLARGVGQVVVAADDVGDAHVVVVDHDGSM
jgi:hypothetical protein